VCVCVCVCVCMYVSICLSVIDRGRSCSQNLTDGTDRHTDSTTKFLRT
jgi:hypothetical protein